MNFITYDPIAQGIVPITEQQERFGLTIYDAFYLHIETQRKNPSYHVLKNLSPERIQLYFTVVAANKTRDSEYHYQEWLKADRQQQKDVREKFNIEILASVSETPKKIEEISQIVKIDIEMLKDLILLLMSRQLISVNEERYSSVSEEKVVSVDYGETERTYSERKEIYERLKAQDRLDQAQKLIARGRRGNIHFFEGLPILPPSGKIKGKKIHYCLLSPSYQGMCPSLSLFYIADKNLEYFPGTPIDYDDRTIVYGPGYDIEYFPDTHKIVDATTRVSRQVANEKIQLGMTYYCTSFILIIGGKFPLIMYDGTEVPKDDGEYVTHPMLGTLAWSYVKRRMVVLEEQNRLFSVPSAKIKF